MKPPPSGAGFDDEEYTRYTMSITVKADPLK
jgi:hypothetical protein